MSNSIIKSVLQNEWRRCNRQNGVFQCKKYHNLVYLRKEVCLSLHTNGDNFDYGGNKKQNKCCGVKDKIILIGVLLFVSMTWHEVVSY